MPCLGVCAGLRIKGSLVVYQGGAQAFGQFFQYVVRREAYPSGLSICCGVFAADGQRHMSVTQVVAQPCQRQAGFDAGGDDGFVRSADADDFAALGLQKFALSQHGAAVEKQANVVASVGFGAQAAAHAQFEGQR